MGRSRANSPTKSLRKRFHFTRKREAAFREVHDKTSGTWLCRGPQSVGKVDGSGAWEPTRRGAGGVGRRPALSEDRLRIRRRRFGGRRRPACRRGRFLAQAVGRPVGLSIDAVLPLELG